MFGFSNKPGRGISKEQAAKRNYFDIYGRHFGHITGASFWYSLTNLVFFAAAYILFYAYFIANNGDNLVAVVVSFIQGKNIIVPFVPFIPFMFIGPFTAGFTYVIRNYTKQEPTFLISDFFEHTKNNWKQALIVSAGSTVLAYALIQAFVFYNSFFLQNRLPVGVLYVLSGLVLALYLITMFYIYPLMVTFKMKLGVIIKNAWTFAVLKLPQNLIICVFLLAVNIAVFVVLFMYLPLFIYAFVLALFMFGFTSFTANYYIWHVMDKYIVQLVTPKKESEAIFNDEEYPDIDDGYDEYGEVKVDDEYLL